MKKYIAVVSACLLLLGTISAGFSMEIPEEPTLFDSFDEAMFVEDDYSWDVCYFSDGELEQIEMIHDLFIDNAEEKIIQQHFSDSAYQDLVRSLTDEFVRYMSLVEDVCKDGQTEMYVWEMPVDMMEVTDMLTDYIKMI